MTDVATTTAARTAQDRLEQLAERLLVSYNAHDVEALGAYYAEDAVVRVGDLVLEGRRAIADFWAMWFAAFPNVQSEARCTALGADRMMLEWSEWGTQRRAVRAGDLVVPSFRRRLSWRGVSIYRWSGEQIRSVDYHVDRLQLAEQLLGPVGAVLGAWGAIGRLMARVTRGRPASGGRRPGTPPRRRRPGR